LFGQAAQIACAIGVRVVERANENLVEHGTLEPRAVLGHHPGVTEILRRRVFDHAVFDVAALCRVVFSDPFGRTDTAV
jgi:hypothetical protein